MFIKDFTGWHKKKSKINSKKNFGVFFYEKEVWWVSIGHNVRFEQDGKGPEFARPVLIFRKFNEFLFFGIPLSSTRKRSKYYHSFQYQGDRQSTAVLSQLRAYDSNRLIDKAGAIDDNDFKLIQQKLLKIIAQVPKK